MLRISQILLKVETYSMISLGVTTLSPSILLKCPTFQVTSAIPLLRAAHPMKRSASSMGCPRDSSLASCRAARIKREHNLTFFDSFHAASALSLPDQSIVSFDRAYDRVAGLRRIDPADFA